MEFYILPESREQCEKKINRIFKKLTNKPEVTFGEVERRKEETRVKVDGGIAKYVRYINVIPVTIGDIKQGEWEIVATVHHYDEIVTIANPKMFKLIPEQFGLDYHKCDCCGSKRTNRKTSHIMYNTIKDEWSQVGSECVNKLVAQGKYLSDMMVNLYIFIKDFGWCDSFGDISGWKVPDHSWSEGVLFRDAIMVCKLDYDMGFTEWKKPKYDGWIKVSSGSNEHLKDSPLWATIRKDPSVYDNTFIDNVIAYTAKKQRGESEFTDMMLDAIEDEYIAKGEMFIAWFAMKNYLDSLAIPVFEKLLERYNIVKGEKYNFTGTLIKKETFEVDNYYSYGTSFVTVVTLKDNASGITFEKEISGMHVIDKFKSDDDTYHFAALVKYIDLRKQKVILGGRLSKVKTT